MSKVISSILVGLGFDYDKKGAQEIESGIGSIKSKALQLGAVVAGGFGLKSLTADFASSRDMLGKFSETFGLIPDDVMALGNAITTQGGSLGGFMSQLENLEKARARILVGDVGFFAPAAKAGLDPNVIANAESATDAYLGLADAFATMNTQQRLNAAEALGLDESSIRLLSQGRGDIEQLVTRFKQIRTVTDDSTAAAARFTKEWTMLKQNVGSATDEMSSDVLPFVNDVIEGINKWTEANKELVNSNALLFAGFATIAAGSGSLKTLAAMARYIPLIGTGLASVAAGAASVAAVSAAAVGGYVVGGLIEEQLPDDYKTNLGRSIAHLLATFGNDEAQAALDAEASVGGYTPTFQKQVDAGYFGDRYEPTPVPPSNGNLSNVDFASQRRAATSGQSAPTRQDLNITVEMDGDVVGRKVVTIVDGMAQTAIDDLASSTGG